MTAIRIDIPNEVALALETETGVPCPAGWL